ncbi:hypothetical protein PR048_023785 [Dryococelus australis]|uniref:Neutral ceramidase n=1 Tax=Dryococelus australis TaxID=614101 RepID=A0ABQ9GV06_9NEOP|nr:hypothetical protein PR048_023785 [Dryococelus australis]
MQGERGGGTHEKTRRPVASSGTIPTCENPGGNPAEDRTRFAVVGGEQCCARMHYPYPWQPSIVPTQLVLIGDVAIACVPGEFTTMSGRRLRHAIKEAMPAASRVVIAGLCNEYSSYIATPEEYEVQRYEGASTIFGPYTLPLYLQQYSSLAKSLEKSRQEMSTLTPKYAEDAFHSTCQQATIGLCWASLEYLLPARDYRVDKDTDTKSRKGSINLGVPVLSSTA